MPPHDPGSERIDVIWYQCSQQEARLSSTNIPYGSLSRRPSTGIRRLRHDRGERGATEATGWLGLFRLADVLWVLPSKRSTRAM